MQGVLSACIVHAMAAAARAARRHSLFKPPRASGGGAPSVEAGGLSFYRRRFATGLLVCLACSMASYTFPPMRVPKHELLAELFTQAPLNTTRGNGTSLGGNWVMYNGMSRATLAGYGGAKANLTGPGIDWGSDIVTHAVAPITFDGGAITRWMSPTDAHGHHNPDIPPGVYTADDCWFECGGSGPCDWCGAHRGCCMSGYADDHPDCPEYMAAYSHHTCVALRHPAPLDCSNATAHALAEAARAATHRSAYSDEDAIPVLATFAVLTLVLMLLSITLPIPNGVFFPIFLLGATTGRLYAEVLHSYFHYDGNTLPAAVVSVVGAASLAAGTTQTLSTALIVLEMTREMSFLVPVLLAVIVSCCVSELLSYSIYDQILVLKDLPYMPHLRTRGLGDRIASEIMKPTQKAIAAAAEKAKRADDDDDDGDRSVSPGGGPGSWELPRSNPQHPHNPRQLSGAAPELTPLKPLVYTMTVEEVLGATLDKERRDRYLPLVESEEVPALLGSVTRVQLVQWFREARAAYEDEYLDALYAAQFDAHNGSFPPSPRDDPDAAPSHEGSPTKGRHLPGVLAAVQSGELLLEPSVDRKPSLDEQLGGGGDDGAAEIAVPTSLHLSSARGSYSADDADPRAGRAALRDELGDALLDAPPTHTPTDSTAAPSTTTTTTRPSAKSSESPSERARRAVEAPSSGKLPGSGRGHHRTASGGRGGGGRGHQRTPSDTKRISAIDAASIDAPSSYAELALRDNRQSAVGGVAGRPHLRIESRSMSGDPDLDSPSDRARAATDGELFEPFSPVHYAHKEADGHYERVSGISGGSARVSTHSRKISGGSEPGGDPPARRRSCTDPRDAAAAAARLARGSPPRASGGSTWRGRRRLPGGSGGSSGGVRRRQTVFGGARLTDGS